ncbi:MAG: calcium/sodium antiporter [bacterium]|jgi:cation:H+ antiporter|nr:MAG: sodium:calcium antiporter [bacterium]
MILHVFLFLLGLVALYFGAEWLVRGAARLARRVGVSPLVVGLTIVAFGTSSPELVVSVFAAARGQADVAVGNVVGSNILNIALILGLAAILRPLRAQMRLIVRETPIMIAAGVALAVLGLDGTVSRPDAALLLAGLFAYVAFVLRGARREAVAIKQEFERFESAEALAPDGRGRARDVLLIVVGLTALSIGARLLVDASLVFARTLGVSELVIGVTVVAVGTSLPELATSLLAVWRDEADIAVGNVVGSNIFNILGILGLAGLVSPLAMNPGLFRLELPVMLAVSILLAPILATGLRIGRIEGALLLAGYALFTGALLARGA